MYSALSRKKATQQWIGLFFLSLTFSMNTGVARGEQSYSNQASARDTQLVLEKGRDVEREISLGDDRGKTDILALGDLI